jgi:hypothetical protein
MTNDKFQQCHPYDLGVTKNWKVVFGEKWYWWFLPTQRSVLGDGIHFEANPLVQSNN